MAENTLRAVSSRPCPQGLRPSVRAEDHSFYLDKVIMVMFIRDSGARKSILREALKRQEGQKRWPPFLSGSEANDKVFANETNFRIVLKGTVHPK